MYTCGYKNFPERKSREHAREKKELFQQYVETTEADSKAECMYMFWYLNLE